MNHRIFPLGETAITIDYGNVIDEEINKLVLALFQWWSNHQLKGIKDIIPAYSSLTLVFEPNEICTPSAGMAAFDFLERRLSESAEQVKGMKEPQQRRIEIPVCYAPPLAPDLELLCRKKNLDASTAIQLHCSSWYRVYLIGFLPGFAYMGKVDDIIALPRRSNPRVRVEAGSVGIAGNQTGIYPMESPGGWNIIGRTPLKLFDSGRKEPALLHAGDLVKFTQITLDEYNTLKQQP